jgi:hypothetical protein
VKLQKLLSRLAKNTDGIDENFNPFEGDYIYAWGQSYNDKVLNLWWEIMEKYGTDSVELNDARYMAYDKVRALLYQRAQTKVNIDSSLLYSTPKKFGVWNIL